MSGAMYTTTVIVSAVTPVRGGAAVVGDVRVALRREVVRDLQPSRARVARVREREVGATRCLRLVERDRAARFGRASPPPAAVVPAATELPEPAAVVPALAAPSSPLTFRCRRPLLAKIKMPAMIAITATIAMTGPQRRKDCSSWSERPRCSVACTSTFLVALTCRSPRLRNARWRRRWCRGTTPRPAGAVSTSVGSPSAMTAPWSIAIIRSETDRTKRHVVLDHDQARARLVADAQQQRAERLGLALGDAARRLVEQDHRRPVREQAREVDDPPRAGRQLADELRAVRARARAARSARRPACVDLAARSRTRSAGAAPRRTGRAP